MGGEIHMMELEEMKIAGTGSESGNTQAAWQSSTKSEP
jgi:hypothetical protein